MNRLFDPWADARLIAERLRMSDARLVIFIGAAEWCDKCRALLPQIEALAVGAPANETWLWLDLEDHAEFLGDYVPDDLPQLIMYKDSMMAGCKILNAAPATIIEALRTHISTTQRQADPGILANLLREDWVL